MESAEVVTCSAPVGMACGAGRVNSGGSERVVSYGTGCVDFAPAAAPVAYRSDVTAVVIGAASIADVLVVSSADAESEVRNVASSYA